MKLVSECGIEREQLSYDFITFCAVVFVAVFVSISILIYYNYKLIKKVYKFEVLVLGIFFVPFWVYIYRHQLK